MWLSWVHFWFVWDFQGVTQGRRWLSSFVWVGGDDRDLLEANLLLDGLILAASSMDNGKCGYLGRIFGWFGAQGSQMVDLECQDTLGGDDKKLLEANLLLVGFIQATLSMDKGKCGHLECILGWFGVLRGATQLH